jgi:predicted O-methyltransferase YrrM
MKSKAQDYLEKINEKETNELLVSFMQYAKEKSVPIITYEGIRFLLQIIQLRNVKNVLEIGTAIGYSAINIALKTDAFVTSIERNNEMYELAKINIEQANVSNKITLIKGDALEVDETTLGTFDLIFIDAAKAQSIHFFEKYETILNKGGVIVTDNLLFHGLVDHKVESKNLRQLLTKIDRFNKYVVTRSEYDTFIYEIGDGMSVSIKKE